jgi:hypothetical protein
MWLQEKRLVCRPYLYFEANHEGKRLFGRHRHRLENNIKLNSKKMEWEKVD